MFDNEHLTWFSSASGGRNYDFQVRPAMSSKILFRISLDKTLFCIFVKILHTAFF